MKRSCLGVVIVSLIAPCAAIAGPITFAFSGTIVRVGTDIDDGTFAIGQSVVGQYTFESTTPDASPDSDMGFYTNGVSTVSFTFGTYSGTAGPGTIFTHDDAVYGFGTFDTYGARDIPANGAAVNGRGLETFGLQLLDDTLTMLSSDALPLTPPSPFRNDNGNTTFLILQFDPTNDANIVAAQVRATVGPLSSVPEPSVLALLGVGLAGLGWMGRRRNSLRR